MIARPVRNAFCLTLAACLLSWAGPGFADSTTRRNVEVEWEAVPNASVYEVQIVRTDTKNAKPLRVKLQSPKWSATVKPGLYKMQIRSYDERGAPGDWSPASELQVRLPSVILTSPTPDSVLKAKSDSFELPLKWENIPGSKAYKVEVHSTTSSWHYEKEVQGTEVQIDVPVAESFTWNVRAIDENSELGESNATPPSVQVVGPSLKPPEIEKPISKYIDELHWSPSKNAKSYNYEIKYYNPTKNRWVLIEKKNSYPTNSVKFDISRPSGLYRLKVQAVADQRQPSPPVQMEVETHGGFRDPAALERELLRDSISKPTSFYAITSYLITDIQYQAVNRDANTVPSFKALGGTGRVGLGYHNPESNWGTFGIIDESGFEIAGKNYTFSAVELHATRKLELGQSGLLLLGTGLFSKELPGISGSETASYTSVGKVRTIGPHFGFIYWVPFGQRFGLQVNARAYESLLGSSFNGQTVMPSLSYQYGLLGSYRLTSTWMGYAGYAYRIDQANYKANSTDPHSFSYGQDGVNSIVIDGNYLNFILEFSF